MEILNNFAAFVWRLGALELHVIADVADDYLKGNQNPQRFWGSKNLLDLFLWISTKEWIHLNAYKGWAEEKKNNWGKWVQTL